jgi:hypothetical protein
MDTWLDTPSVQKVPEKSLAAPWLAGIMAKTQVKPMIAYAGTMKAKYKETSLGGLAVNVIEC